MKIVITGVSGLLGTNAAVLLAQSAQVSGCYRGHPVHIPGVQSDRVDVTDALATSRWIAAIKPDVVWHTAGLTNVDGCEQHPEAARLLNVESAAIVASAAAACGAHLIHVSTDHLFDGRQELYAEDAPVTPLNVYAATKAEAEIRVVALHPRPLIVRTNFFGWGHAYRRSFSDWVIGSLRRRESIGMFTDVFFTPILVNDLVTTAMELLACGAHGVYNVAGAERVSKFDFGLAVARQFECDPAAIVANSVESFSFAAQRPRDMSLNVAKTATMLGRPLPGVKQSIERLAALEAEGWPPRVASAVESTS